MNIEGIDDNITTILGHESPSTSHDDSLIDQQQIITKDKLNSIENNISDHLNDSRIIKTRKEIPFRYELKCEHFINYKDSLINKPIEVEDAYTLKRDAILLNLNENTYHSIHISSNNYQSNSTDFNSTNESKSNIDYFPDDELASEELLERKHQIANGIHHNSTSTSSVTGKLKFIFL